MKTLRVILLKTVSTTLQQWKDQYSATKVLISLIYAHNNPRELHCM